MLLNSNIRRIVALKSFGLLPTPFGVTEKTLNTLWTVFNSDENCIISFKDFRQCGETTTLLAYALSYIQLYNVPVIFIVQDSNSADSLKQLFFGNNFLKFMTLDKFDIAICGRKDIGLVIVDSQVSDASKIIKHSHVIPNTQFVISTDETHIRYI